MNFSFFNKGEVDRLPTFNVLGHRQQQQQLLFPPPPCMECYEKECIGHFSKIYLNDCYVYNKYCFSNISEVFKNICFLCYEKEKCTCKKKKIFKLIKISNLQYIFSWNTKLLTGKECYEIIKSDKYLFNWMVVPPLNLITEHLHHFKTFFKNINKLKKNINNNSLMIELYNKLLHDANYKKKSFKELLNSKDGLIIKNIVGKRCFFTARAVIIYHDLDYETVYISECIKDQLELVDSNYLTGKVVVNRQPSLRMESLISLKYKIVKCDCKYKKQCCFPVISIPIFIIKPLNADFDGDECNIHFVNDKNIIINLNVDNYIIDSQNDNVLIGPLYEHLDFIYYYFTERCCQFNSMLCYGQKKLPKSFVDRWKSVNKKINPFKCSKALFSYLILNKNDNLDRSFNIKHGIVQHDSVFSNDTLCVGSDSFIFYYHQKYGKESVINMLYPTINNMLNQLLNFYPRPSPKYVDFKMARNLKKYTPFDTFLKSGGKIKQDHIYQSIFDTDLATQKEKIEENVISKNYYDGLTLLQMFDNAPINRWCLIDASNSKIANSGYLTKKILKILEHVVYDKITKKIFNIEDGKIILTNVDYQTECDVLNKFKCETVENRYIYIGNIAVNCITEFFTQMYLKSSNTSNLNYLKETKRNNFKMLEKILNKHNFSKKKDYVSYRITKLQQTELASLEFSEGQLASFEDYTLSFLSNGLTNNINLLTKRLSDVLSDVDPFFLNLFISTVYVTGVPNVDMDDYSKFFFTSQYQSMLKLANNNYKRKNINLHNINDFVTGIEEVVDDDDEEEENVKKKIKIK